MEQQYKTSINGQSVHTTDLDRLGEAGALADDRVFAELFRMTPYDGATVAKGVLLSRGALVAANGGTGSVLVHPHRAFVGSRTAVATDAKKNLRDIRSAIAVGTAALAQSVTLAPNASGNPRWDLVYAAVTVDADGGSTIRKMKDPDSKVVSAVSIKAYLETTVALGVVAGTTAASPAFPAAPPDAGGTYYVPLAYVRVPTGFGAASAVNAKDIDTVAPVMTMASAAGVASLRPANQQNVTGGTAISGAGTSTQNGALAWSGTTNTRPGAYIPPTMSGIEALVIAIDVGNASSANWSHQHGAIVDDSRDWRYRLFRWTAGVGIGATAYGQFPWNQSGISSVLLPGVVGASAVMPGYSPGTVTTASGLGASGPGGTTQSVASLYATGAAAAATPAAGANVCTNVMPSGTGVYLYVDSSTGALKLGVTGVPLVSVIFWIEATASYENA